MYTKSEIDIKKDNYIKKVTVYKNNEKEPKAYILYFHGGGLVYGTREDLPEFHIKILTDNGFGIIAFDYPLAPESKINFIISDVLHSIEYYINNISSLPYFLFGRSAGAYLCLLASSMKLPKSPNGVISYYGYGFLCRDWFEKPSQYYNTLPKVNEKCLDICKDEICTNGGLESRYSIYVYARQSGKWRDLFYTGREKFFFVYSSLAMCDKLNCPAFLAHSINDTDVPYDEFKSLSSKYKCDTYIVSEPMHDFDRNTQSEFTKKLLDKTVEFINKNM